jgi:hypothetical protein
VDLPISPTGTIGVCYGTYLAAPNNQGHFYQAATFRYCTVDVPL